MRTGIFMTKWSSGKNEYSMDRINKGKPDGSI